MTTPLITYISTYLSGTVTSDFVTSAGNLLCAFSSTQVSSVSPTVFAASISSLSSINLACPNIASWYALAKTVSAYGSSLYTSSSSISELGSVMSGITTTDLASVSADAIHSFSTLSFKFMPAATVNSMSATQDCHMSKKLLFFTRHIILHFQLRLPMLLHLQLVEQLHQERPRLLLPILLNS